MFCIKTEIGPSGRGTLSICCCDECCSFLCACAYECLVVNNYILMAPRFVFSCMLSRLAAIRLWYGLHYTAGTCSASNSLCFFRGPNRCWGTLSLQNATCKTYSLCLGSKENNTKWNKKAQIALLSESVSTCRSCSRWNILIDQAKKSQRQGNACMSIPT